MNAYQDQTEEELFPQDHTNWPSKHSHYLFQLLRVSWRCFVCSSQHCSCYPMDFSSLTFIHNMSSTLSLKNRENFWMTFTSVFTSYETQSWYLKAIKVLGFLLTNYHELTSLWSYVHDQSEWCQVVPHSPECKVFDCVVWYHKVTARY